MNKRRKILITNDDGIHAKGIEILIEVLKKTTDHELFVVAPLNNQSGTGMSFSHRNPVAIKTFSSEPGLSKWAVEGSPVDCTKLALTVLFQDTLPDLVISGINDGSNAGQNVLYSGTVGAVLDAGLKGVPAIALSQIANIDLFQTETGGLYITTLMDYLLKHPVGHPNCLNVNFPGYSEDYKGMRLTLPGHEFCVEDPILIAESKNRSFYMIGTKTEEYLENPSEELRSLQEGYVTVCPVMPWNILTNRFDDFYKKQSEFQAFLTNSPLYNKVHSKETIG